MEKSSKGAPRWSGIPAARSSEAGLKARLILVVGLLLVASLSGVGSLFLLLSQDPQQTVVQETRRDVARGVADIVAESFVTGSQLYGVEVADGVVFNSDGIDILAGPHWSGSRTLEVSGFMLEEHRYSIVRAAAEGETHFEVTVLMLVDDSSSTSPVLAAAPALRRTNPNPTEGYADYRDLVDDDSALPSGARAYLQRWAQAWAADDGETLKILTGDPAVGVRYLGLGGYNSAGVEVISAIQLPERGSWVARVRILLEDPLLSGLFGTQHRISTDLDVTIQDAASGNPRIVGWGPAGAAILSPPGPESVRVPETRR